ncbi:MAG: hypothetical protein Kow0056_06830 [Coriobacteriia bacterium]
MKAVFFESLPYESAFKVGSHHYARRFVEAGFDVIWFSHPFSALHLIHPVRREIDVRWLGWRKGPYRTADDVLYYSPFTLLPSSNKPLLRSRPVVRNSVRLTVPPLMSVLRKEGFDKPDVIWLTNPSFQPIASRIDAACRAVRIADAMADFAGVPEAIRELESAAISSADVVFAVSEQEYARVAAERNGVIRLPNGVDFAHFSRKCEEPERLSAIDHPRVIYVGALEYWFDAELVAEAARRSPEAQFVLIGPVRIPLDRLVGLDNVHILGSCPYEEIPAYMQHADVAIIPFVRDSMVDAIHPIKVYEYLAAGLPVLATRWTELEAMNAPITLTERDGFSGALSEMLVEVGASSASGTDAGGDPVRLARTQFALANTWDARFQVVIEALGQFPSDCGEESLFVKNDKREP